MLRLFQLVALLRLLIYGFSYTDFPRVLEQALVLGIGERNGDAVQGFVLDVVIRLARHPCGFAGNDGGTTTTGGTVGLHLLDLLLELDNLMWDGTTAFARFSKSSTIAKVIPASCFASPCTIVSSQ